MGAWWFTAIGTLVAGFCYSIQKYLQWKRYQLPTRVAYYNDGIAYYFRTLLILLFVRSFICEWSIVPFESLKPTLLLGDRVLTDKSAYGIRLPITGHLLIPLKQPKRGDIVVFRSPSNPSDSLMKRLIGLPGDRIQYSNKRLTINGNQVPQVTLRLVEDEEVESSPQSWLLCEENLNGCAHKIYIRPYLAQSLEAENPIDIIVPEGHYFVMGDHRDNSIDSRVWGCVPDRYLLGKAKRIWLSWNKPTVWWKPHTLIRWSRLGMKINGNSVEPSWK